MMKHPNLVVCCICCAAAFINGASWLRALNVLFAMFNFIIWVIINWGRVRP